METSYRDEARGKRNGQGGTEDRRRTHVWNPGPPLKGCAVGNSLTMPRFASTPLPPAPVVTALNPELAFIKTFVLRHRCTSEHVSTSATLFSSPPVAVRRPNSLAVS